MDGLNVYVSGYMPVNGIEVATYWKDEVDVQCGSGQFNSRGNSIFIKENDVYLGGYELNEEKVKVAKYWRNKEEVVLTDGTRDAEVLSIFVQGKDVYAAGIEVDVDYISKGIYWKNGVPVKFKISQIEKANAIYVVNDDVHIVGLSGDGAFYWKNGNYTILAPRNYYSLPMATSVLVSNGNVYISGSARNSHDIPVALYWKNGIVTELTQTEYSDAYSVRCAFDDVYVTGNYVKQGQIVSAFWKNNELTEIPDFEIANRPDSIAICFNIFCIAGNVIDSNGRTIGAYWKDKEITKLTKGVASYATGIFID